MCIKYVILTDSRNSVVAHIPVREESQARTLRALHSTQRIDS